VDVNRVVAHLIDNTILSAQGFPEIQTAEICKLSRYITALWELPDIAKRDGQFRGCLLPRPGTETFEDVAAQILRIPLAPRRESEASASPAPSADFLLPIKVVELGKKLISIPEFSLLDVLLA